MIWAKLVWGLVLAVLLGATFRRAWRWEHGAEAELLFGAKWGRETYVFVPPTILFWILLVFLVMFVWQFGAPEGLVRFAALTGDVLLILSVYFVLLLVLLPLLRRVVSARACAVLWLVPAFLSWQANMLIATLPLPRRTVYVPRGALPVLGAVWFAGFLAVGGYYLISHLVFRAKVRQSAYPERDADVLALWEAERAALDYRRPVALLRADVPAPFSMGRTRRSRCTVLPVRSNTPAELTMIFRHELHHLQRCDVDTKVFLCLCNALCWFNPLVWIATRKAAEDLERSCDEIVTETMDDAQRKQYAHLLLDAAAPGRGCTTCLSAAAGTLRYRLKSITDRRRRLRGTLLLMAAMLLCTACFGTVSLSDARGCFTELVLSDAEIQSIYIHDGEGTDLPRSAGESRDDAALRAALDGIELEHIAGLRDLPSGDGGITFVLSGGRYAYLTDRQLLIRTYGSGTDCYLVKNAIDWEAIHAALA